MKKLVFATNNPNKLLEIRNSITNHKIASLKDLNINQEIPETGITLKENALQKAKYINNKTGLDCFADDTGLEIEALNFKPGVYSARYAGENCSADRNKKSNSCANRFRPYSWRSGDFGRLGKSFGRS